MESFACLIQTHTGQDKEGTERGRDRETVGDLQRNRQRAEEKKNTKYKKERLLRQVDWEERTKGSEQEKIATPRPTTHHPTSVFIKRIVSISPRVEAFISSCRWRGHSIVLCWRLQGLAGLS